MIGLDELKRKLYKHSVAMTDAEAAVKTAEQMPTMLKIGDREYLAKPPTISALLRVSSIVSKYPQRESKVDRSPEEVLSWVLLNGSQYADMGDILAALILGWMKYPSDEFLAEYAELSAYIEDNFTPIDYDSLMHALLNNEHVVRFFECTASLSELSLIEGGREETQSGG